LSENSSRFNRNLYEKKMFKLTIIIDLNQMFLRFPYILLIEIDLKKNSKKNSKNSKRRSDGNLWKLGTYWIRRILSL
jgi:hypothetical protein